MESLIKSNEFLLIISLDSVEDLCRQILDELISNAFGLAASDGSNPPPATPVAEPNEFLHGRNSPSRSMGTITFTALQGLVATIAIFQNQWPCASVAHKTIGSTQKALLVPKCLQSASITG